MIETFPFRPREQGVTVIELMIVILVVGVLVALTLPSFQRTIERRRMVGAAENIFALLQYAKTESIKQNSPVEVQFDAGIWCLGVDDDLTSACDCSTDPPPTNCTVNGVEKTLKGSDFRDIVLTASVPPPIFAGTTFVFNPRDGSASDDGRFQVTTPHNESRCVEMSTLGRIKMTNDACL